MSKKSDLKGGVKPVDLEELKGQLAKFHNEIRKYLDGYEAAIETSKFSVEQTGEGLTVEVAIKASIQPRKRGGASKR